MVRALPFSERSVQLVRDANGERRVLVDDLRNQLGVDALIRVRQNEFAQLQKLTKKYVHFNLETTLNREGKRYAVVPIVRSGYRDATGTEILPVIDPTRARIGLCELVLQKVRVESVTAEFWGDSIESIRSVDDLKRALLDRYAPMFPDLSSPDLLARGCALSRIAFEQ